MLNDTTPEYQPVSANMLVLPNIRAPRARTPRPVSSQNNAPNTDDANTRLAPPGPVHTINDADKYTDKPNHNYVPCSKLCPIQRAPVPRSYIETNTTRTLAVSLYFLDAAKTAQKSSSPCSVRARLNCSLAADATGRGNPKQSPSAFEDDNNKRNKQRGPGVVVQL